MNYTYNGKEALQHCQEIFDDAPEKIRFRLIAELASLKESKEPQAIKISPEDGSLEERIKQCAALNKKGYAVFWNSQQYKAGCQSESYGDIEKIKCCVIDLDGEPLSTAWAFFEKTGIAPFKIIETSEGKYQIVIKLLEGDVVQVDRFNEVAGKLAILCGGDLQVCKATQVFRMPGFWHQKEKEQGFLSRVVYPDPEKAEEVVRTGYTLSDLEIAIRNFEGYSAKREDIAAADEFHVAKGKKGEGKIDLKAIKLKGEIAFKVKAGERHDTALRFMTKLLMEGEEEPAAWEKLDKMIGRYFESPEEFLEGGRRRGELKLCVRYAVKYEALNKKKELEERREKEKEFLKIIDELEEKSEGAGGTLEPGEAAKEWAYRETTELKLNRFSDAAILDRLIQRYGGCLRQVGSQLYAFNRRERVWRVQLPGQEHEVDDLLKVVLKDCIKDEKFVGDLCMNSAGDFQISKFRSETGKLLSSAKKQMLLTDVKRCSRLVRARGEDFDSCEETILCPNGVLNIRTGELWPARPEDLMLCMCGAEWNEEAQCEEFLGFLDDLFEVDQQGLIVDGEDSKEEGVTLYDPVAEKNKLIEFIQMLMGYTLSGSVAEQKLFIHKGGGANGKSTLMEILYKVMGGYSVLINGQAITSSVRHNSKPAERLGARAEGHRLAIVDDIAAVTVWDEAFVKSLTGERIVARAEYERERVAANRCKFWIGVNEVPKTESEGDSLKRRLCIIPYNNQFEATLEADRWIKEFSRKELSGILRWACEGYRKLLKAGKLPELEAIQEEVNDYTAANFIIQNTVFEMFRGSNSDKDADWVASNDIVDQVNMVLRAKGSVATISRMTLAGLLNKLHIPRCKKRPEGASRSQSPKWHYRVKKVTATSLL